MNKFKKISAAVIATVMAGSMFASVSLTSCSTTTDDSIRVSVGYSTTDTTAITFSSSTLPLVNADGSEATTSITLPDGVTYNKNDLKPLWNAFEEALDISITDVWTQASDNLAQCVTEGLSNYDLIYSGTTSTITTQANSGNLLNLADYLEQMPNLKAFLYENTMAEIGILADADTGAFYYAPYYAGMNDAERYNLFRKDYISQLLDYADLGTDVTAVASSTAATMNSGTVTYAAQAAAKKTNKLGNRSTDEVYDGTKASIESYMGTDGGYIVETSDPDGSGTIYVKVDYSAALSAAKNADSDLYKAISTATNGTAYTGSSGNIVDLQNFVINQTNGTVKGEHLLSILREYMDVAYVWAESEDATEWSQFYGATVHGVTTTRGDVFNSEYACWDVDLYAAIGRVYVTCGNMLGKYQSQASEYTNNGASTWLLVPRTGYTNRTTRVTAMIGELYGVRGMESMTYVDSSGNLRQTRFNTSTWDALTKFSAFHTEGLVPSFNTTDVDSEIGTVESSSSNSLYDGTNTHFQGLSSNDYVHTQTTGYTNAYASSTYVETKDGYNWTCVVTPVSRWLTNDTSTWDSSTSVLTTNDGLLADRDDDDCTVMRFTESALKLKTGGFVIPATVAEDEEKLADVLALLDYMYSNDGQIETSYGTMSTTDQLSGDATNGYTTTNDGWWYGEKVTSLNINGTTTDISNMTMTQLASKGVVKTNDGGTQYTITDAYADQALVYKNVLYRTGTNSSENGGVSTYDSGYIYNGKMTPYYTQAVRKLCLEQVAVNGYKSESVLSSTNLQNLILGAEGFGIVDNASMVQLCNDMSTAGFEIFSTAMGNGTIQTVTQSIGSNTWYTVAPSVSLPTSSNNTVNGYADFTTLFTTGSKITNYFILEVAWYGANANFSDFGTVTSTSCDFSTPSGIATYIKSIATQYENLYNAAWQEQYSYYKNVIANR